MTSEVKGHLKKKLRTWLRTQNISHMTSNMNISVTICEIWDIKVLFWNQRLNLTLEVKVHLGKKLRTWFKKLTEKVVSRYLKRPWRYMHLKSIYLPQRSSLTSEVRGHINIKIRTSSTKLIEKDWCRYLNQF